MFGIVLVREVRGLGVDLDSNIRSLVNSESVEAMCYTKTIV